MDGKLLQKIDSFGDNITRIIRFRIGEILFSSFGKGNFVMNINTLAVSKLEGTHEQAPTGIDNSITLHCQDGQHLWLGTYNYGLFSYNLTTKKFRNFSVSEGLPSSDIVGIEEDDNGNLWLSTSYGLARFNTSENSVQTFFINEGITNYQFHEKSSFKGKDGVIYLDYNFEFEKQILSRFY